MLSNRTLVFLPALATLWVGCSSVEATRRPTTMAEASEIIAKTEGRQVQVTIATARGTEEHLGIVSPLEPGRFLLSKRSGARGLVPFEATRSISYTDRTRGALDGLLAGAIPGGVLGFLVGFCANLNVDGDRTCPMNAPIGLAVGIVMGMVTGAIGAGIGAGAGHRTTLTF